MLSAFSAVFLVLRVLKVEMGKASMRSDNLILENFSCAPII